jgi:hypothetical protein
MAKGRQRDPEREAYWRQMLERQRQSGLSVRAYCVRQGLRESACRAWRRILQHRDLERQQRPVGATIPAFVPVVLAGVQGRISIELRGGRLMHLPASMPAEQLAALAGALEALSPTNREAA